jgi:ribosomal protein S13
MRLVFLDKFVDSHMTLFQLLSDVYGINRRHIDFLLLNTGFTPSLTISGIELVELVELEELITANYSTGEDLIEENKNLKHKIKISNSIRSHRYRYKLPANGQRTHTNAQISKKRT